MEDIKKDKIRSKFNHFWYSVVLIAITTFILAVSTFWAKVNFIDITHKLFYAGVYTLLIALFSKFWRSKYYDIEIALHTDKVATAFFLGAYFIGLSIVLLN